MKMIHKVSFENFRSFDSKTEVSFLAHGNRTVNQWNGFCKANSGKKLSTIKAIFGANAAGKSNVLKGIATIFSVLGYADIAKSSPGELLPTFPFRFHKNPKAISKFELTFECADGQLYSYHLSMSPEEIFSEALHKLSDDYKITSTCFKREGVKTELGDAWNFLSIPPEAPLKSSILTQVKILWPNHEAVLPVYDFIDKTSFNFNWFGQRDFLDDHEYLFYKDFDKNPKLKKRILDFLGDHDFGLHDLEIDIHKQDGNSINLSVEGVHFRKGLKYGLPMVFESEGTRVAIRLLNRIIESLDSGGVILLDEMDSSLHPLIVHRIVNLFLNQESNPRHSQLIFTTHSPSLFDVLANEQILLATKNIELETVLSTPAIRPEIVNRSAYYLASLLGGVPLFK